MISSVCCTVKFTFNQLDKMIATETAKREAAHSMAESARALGYKEDSTIIQTAKEEWHEANDKIIQYNEMYNRLLVKKNAQMNEYPTATYVWYYLDNLGYNDYVKAGILGNFMTETGGQTLNIVWDISSNGYYGMAQWNKGHKYVWGKNLEGQCKYLADSMTYELNTYGFCYKKGFNFEKFKALTDERAAALAFATCYERCGSASYSVRQRNATIAYNYFTK